MSPADATRPGLAKTRGHRPVRIHLIALVSSADSGLRAMFEAADTISEGSVKSSVGPPVWFGTTSLILPWPAGLASEASRAYVAAFASRDPHARLRAVRIAHREASLRAPLPIGRAECEVHITQGSDGLRIDVDVQAPLTLPSRTGELGPRRAT